MKTSVYTILGIISIIIVIVMMKTLTSVVAIIPETNLTESTELLEEYIPMESVIWTYSDGKTYNKLMVTEQIFQSDKFKHLIVKGEEGDESIKSYKDNYIFEYTYKIEEDKLTRKLEGNVLIDGFEEVVLLKLPLKENNEWQDNWIDLSGESYVISSKIKRIMENGQIIVVESVEKNGKFIVERTIEIGKGTTDFKIIEKYDDIEFERGYQLFAIENLDYQGFDNYMAILGNEKIGTSINTISSSNELEEGINKKNDSVTSTLAGTDFEKVSSERIPVQENEEIDEDVRLAIESSVKTFNEKWITFINEGDMSIMDTITPNASVEKIIDAYKDKKMTQTFLAMDINRIVLKGNVANAYVYEKIQRNMDGDIEILIYNWIYEIDKINGEWLVEGYIENKTP